MAALRWSTVYAARKVAKNFDKNDVLYTVLNKGKQHSYLSHKKESFRPTLTTGPFSDRHASNRLLISMLVTLG